MSKTRYRVLKNAEEIHVITDDGGIACIREVDAEEYAAITEYYQERFDAGMIESETLWEELGEGKMYCKEWQSGYETDKELQEKVEDALDWLCMGCEFELDESIWPTLDI